jgi:hypothetical protein
MFEFVRKVLNKEFSNSSPADEKMCKELMKNFFKNHLTPVKELSKCPKSIAEKGWINNTQLNVRVVFPELYKSEPYEIVIMQFMNEFDLKNPPKFI